MSPLFFAKQADFSAWLAANHAVATEVAVGFYKKGSGKPSLTWSESVDEALCFGWIDGVRRSVDAESYRIRFTPRKPSSIWSAVNIQKAADLTAQGLMQPEGLAAFALRKAEKSAIYAFEAGDVAFSTEFEAIFKGNPTAWAYFETLAPSYKKTSTHWVVTAKQAATQLKRLHELIADSAAGTNKWKDNKYK